MMSTRWRSRRPYGVDLSATKSATDAKFTMILSDDTSRATSYDWVDTARRRAGGLGVNA